jgi:hypothetical protein
VGDWRRVGYPLSKEFLSDEHQATAQMTPA